MKHTADKSKLTATVTEAVWSTYRARIACGRCPLTSEELLAVLAAFGHPQRLRIIAALEAGPVHVSELARRLELSRPLLYLHLERLEKAGLVTGRRELSPDGKALKLFELVPFDLHLNIDTVTAALRADEAHDETINPPAPIPGHDRTT